MPDKSLYVRTYASNSAHLGSRLDSTVAARFLKNNRKIDSNYIVLAYYRAVPRAVDCIQKGLMS